MQDGQCARQQRGVVIDPGRGVHKARSVRPAVRDRDLRGLIDAISPALPRTDRLRVLAGYSAGGTRSSLRAVARRILGGHPVR